MAVTVTAQLLDKLRNQILTSLYGRRDGIDKDEYNIGPKDFRVQIENITSTAASTLSNYGITCLSCTATSSAVYTMTAPVPGVQGRQIFQASTSTLGYAIQLPAGVTILATNGSSFNQMVFYGQGAALELSAISSLTWATKFTPNSNSSLSTF